MERVTADQFGWRVIAGMAGSRPHFNAAPVLRSVFEAAAAVAFARYEAGLYGQQNRVPAGNFIDFAEGCAREFHDELQELPAVGDAWHALMPLYRDAVRAAFARHRWDGAT